MSHPDHDDQITDAPLRQTASTDFRPFTKAERIQQLSDIDLSIARLLKSAGSAVKTLTTFQSPSGIDDCHEAFTASAEKYLEALHSVDVRMKRQINGLKESGIIAKTKPGEGKGESQSGFSGIDNTRNATKVNLDVGWLNSRSGKVAVDMEAELWANARTFLENMEKRNMGRTSGIDGENGKDGGEMDENMTNAS
ncbi:MAG: hypothetical protein M1818_003557 [Claussenomyces sp. TS43310]|nr:MAG: hypothetical protein M1818_003557 [Claussenomyces sp. TS43310]